MAFNRSYLYSLRDQKVSFYANSIGHPARVQIIHQLCDEEPLSVESLKAFHPLSKPTFSQHLKTLRETELVNYREEFPFTFYNLNHKNLDRLKKELRNFLDSI